MTNAPSYLKMPPADEFTLTPKRPGFFDPERTHYAVQGMWWDTVLRECFSEDYEIFVVVLPGSKEVEVITPIRHA